MHSGADFPCCSVDVECGGGLSDGSHLSVVQLSIGRKRGVNDPKGGLFFVGRPVTGSGVPVRYGILDAPPGCLRQHKVCSLKKCAGELSLHQTVKRPHPKNYGASS